MSEAYKVIQLQHPVKFGDETISVLELRRPIGADYREVGGATSNYDLCLKFAARLTDLPDEVFDQMDGIDDVPVIVETVSGFLLSSQKTGSK